MAPGMHPVASAAPASHGARQMPLVVFACTLYSMLVPWPAGAEVPPTSRADAANVPVPAPAPPASGHATAVETAALVLQDAISLTLRRNPDLAAFSMEVRAADAAVLQSGVFPNPVLEVTGDNLRNARKQEAGDRTTSVRIGQLIELGGKRESRKRLAVTGRDLASLDYEAKRIEILSQVAKRFVDVLASQDRRTLAAESVRLAGQFADAVAKRVQAGKVSPVEETRARLAYASAEVELEQAGREFVSARQALGALWGDPNPSFRSAAGDLAQGRSLPRYEELVERVHGNPELTRWSAEIARRQATVDSERAKAVPDVTVSAGVSRYSQFQDRAYMVEFSIPIPVFDLNRGGILEASRRLDRSAEEQRATRVRLLTELAQTYQRLAAIDREIATFRSTLLPGAQSAFDAATLGYQLGKFGFLDVLDAQRTLFQMRSQYLRALADYQRGVAEIERLTAGPMAARSGSAQAQ